MTGAGEPSRELTGEATDQPCPGGSSDDGVPPTHSMAEIMADGPMQVATARAAARAGRASSSRHRGSGGWGQPASPSSWMVPGALSLGGLAVAGYLWLVVSSVPLACFTVALSVVGGLFCWVMMRE